MIWKPDLVLVIAPAIACCLGGKFAANLGGAKSWLHIQDLEVDAAFEMGILSNNLLKSLILKCEKWLIQQFDRVSTIADPMQKRLLAKGLDRDCLQLFPNWVDNKSFYPIENSKLNRKNWGFAENDKIVLYSGSIGEKQGLNQLIELAQLILY
jgi:colanic acid biosynthesis glycosyl transferase WcaI